MEVQYNMRYDVMNDFEKIDHALWLLGLRNEEGMKPATEEEVEESLKVAESCMNLMSKTVATKNVTRKEWGHILRGNVNKEPVFTIGDEVIYHEPNSNYYAPSNITEIRITKEGICYYTDTPRMFKDSDIGVTIHNSMESAKASNAINPVNHDYDSDVQLGDYGEEAQRTVRSSIDEYERD